MFKFTYDSREGGTLTLGHFNMSVDGNWGWEYDGIDSYNAITLME